MNIEKILAYGNKAPKILEEKGVQNPVKIGKGRYMVTDLWGAIIFNHDFKKDEEGTDNIRVYELTAQQFNTKGADVAEFHTTIGDLRAWLVKDTEACAYCAGDIQNGPCPSADMVKRQTEAEEAAELAENVDVVDHLTDEEIAEETNLENAHELHYGWIGPTPINRARLHALIDLTEAPDDTKIVLKAVLNPDNKPVLKGKTLEFFGVVAVEGPDFEIFLCALGDRTEAAPKFHLEAKFETTDFKAAGKKKSKKAAPPTPEPKKAAPKKQGTGKPTKPEPKKAAPRKPVTPTKVVTKTPAKPSGSSLLDRALAKKAQGRKKK